MFITLRKAAVALMPVVVAFALASDCRSSNQSGAVPGSSPGTSAAPDAVEKLAKQGKNLFERNCAHCHGDDARGDEGPSLYDLVKSDTRITTIIKDGIKGEMPKFGSKLNDADIKAIIAFLRTLKE